MTDRTKTILVSAAIVAGVYVIVEFSVKPKVARSLGVPVK